MEATPGRRNACATGRYCRMPGEGGYPASAERDFRATGRKRGEVQMSERPLRVAVIGSGPAGMYAADALLKQSQGPVSVDIFDRLPAPYGLVRYGVAPDHYKIKAVINTFEKTLSDPRVRYFGHVEFGRDLTHADCRRLYDAVVYAVGASSGATSR